MPSDRNMETLMRLTPITLSVALALATMASAGQGQSAPRPVKPQSQALVQQGEALLSAAQYDAATDILETALVIDPANSAAYMALGRAAQGQKLPGKAIRFYAEALKLTPNDVNALAGQGEALVQRGAVERAKANLEKVKAACRADCPQAAQLAAVIAKGPPPEVLAARVPEAGAPKN